MLQKPRVLQLRGAKGEAVVLYRNPLATKKMQCYRLSRRVKNMTNLVNFWISSVVYSMKIGLFKTIALFALFYSHFAIFFMQHKGIFDAIP